MYKSWGLSASADPSEFLPLLFCSLNPTSALLPVRCRASCPHLNSALPQCPVSTSLGSQWWKIGISFLDMSRFWETLTTYLELGNKCHLNFSCKWFQTLSASIIFQLTSYVVLYNILFLLSAASVLDRWFKHTTDTLLLLIFILLLIAITVIVILSPHVWPELSKQ